MAHLKKSIVIQAPVNKVFEYLFEPTNLPEVWPSMVEVMDIQRPPDRKYHFHWKYKMGGVVFDGETQTESFVQDQQVVSGAPVESPAGLCGITSPKMAAPG
jgi:uncharacterized protein YndB with AHSA1/START domain